MNEFLRKFDTIRFVAPWSIFRNFLNSNLNFEFGPVWYRPKPEPGRTGLTGNRLNRTGSHRFGEPWPVVELPQVEEILARVPRQPAFFPLPRRPPSGGYSGSRCTYSGGRSSAPCLPCSTTVALAPLNSMLAPPLSHRATASLLPHGVSRVFVGG